MLTGGLAHHLLHRVELGLVYLDAVYHSTVHNSLQLANKLVVEVDAQLADLIGNLGH